jgi:hypothetical protein
MVKRVRRLAFLACLAVAASCGSSPAAAMVNGAAIRRSTLLHELATIRANPSALTAFEQQSPISGNSLDGFSRAFVAQVLNSEIQAAVVGAAVRSHQLVPPIAVARALSAAGNNGFAAYPTAYQQTLASRTADRLALAADLSGVPLSDAAMQAYYKANVDQFTTYCLDGLALGSATSAASIRDQLQRGTDLATIARTQSIDPNSASQGGMLGCGDVGVFPAFKSTLGALPAGTWSQPVQVGLVWWIVKITQLRVTTLTDAEPAIVQSLLTQYGPFNTFLERALSTATVTVDPALGHFDRSVTPPSVVP